LSSGAKISVVMPTLNSGHHIARAIKSLAAQTFEGAELIVVDSCSTDDTINEVNSHRSDSLPIQILSVPDCPYAQAINLGIGAAMGGFVAFCDSDDYMAPEMMSNMHEAAMKSNSDIVVCDFDMAYPEKTVGSFAQLSDGSFEPIGSGVVDYYYRFGAAPKPNNYLWSRLYRRDFLSKCGLRFPNTIFSGDHIFNLSLLFERPKIAHVGKSLYCYVQHEDSAMRKHVRCSNHGQLFLGAFCSAAQMLEGRSQEIVQPILAIYAFSRIKSILFYAWQAKLPEAETLAALQTFTSNKLAKESLAMCLDKNYIGCYCRMHGFSDEFENILRSMLNACMGNGAMPDMSEVFA
jgi:glycosyltransferase involved in cell wall biosynthesis